MKKFIHNSQYNNQFTKIDKITWFPYVGQDFGKTANRIMVYAHNIPFAEQGFEAEVKRTASPTFFADCLDEYTYINESWSMAFRNFVKGAVGLTENYSKNSSPEIINKIDNFVRQIAYTNFIDGLVKTNSKTNVYIEQEQIDRSRKINLEILKILNITHCICWGNEVFKHVASYATKPFTENNLTTGFSFSKIQISNNQTINVLKVFHPSMPNFKHLQTSTHEIFKKFLNLDFRF